MGIAMEAAAVLLDTSVKIVEKAVKAKIVSIPPVRGITVITSANLVAAPVPVTILPRARPPAKRKNIPHISSFSACFQVRYRIENKLIDKLTFTAWGEGASYPSYFYYVVDGKKYVVDSVEKVQGRVEREEKILENDSGFAIMGIEDGLKCFNDIDATKEKHIIKVKFKEL